MVGQRLNKKTNAVDYSGYTPAGDIEGCEQDADAIPIELQLQGDGSNLGGSIVTPPRPGKELHRLFL